MTLFGIGVTDLCFQIVNIGYYGQFYMLFEIPTQLQEKFHKIGFSK